MEIRLLGPVELHGPAGIVDLDRPQRRCVLAALALDLGQVVSREELVRRVWGVHSPRAAYNSLQSHISKLRTALTQVGISLETRKGGYVLLAEPEQTDLGQYRALLREARAAVEVGNDDAAVGCYQMAARLWRGDPLSGVDSEWIAAMRLTLTSQRLTAEEGRLEIGLRLGQHAVLVDEAHRLAKANLLREHLVALAMHYLFRCGRQAESLQLHRASDRALVRNGIRPGRELQDLQERILKDDRSLDWQPQDERQNEMVEHDPERSKVDTAARRYLIREMRRLWFPREPNRRPRISRGLQLRLRESPHAVRDVFIDPARPNLDSDGPDYSAHQLADLLLDRFNRRLLLLGDKGSGKTSTLLELADDLLDRAARSDAPVPVFLLLSRWHNDGGDLVEWVVEEVRDLYGLKADQVRHLLSTDEIVVLLDGLDEVAAPVRRACAEAINASRSDVLRGVVVSARTADYGDLGLPLVLNGAVTIQPLTPAQVDKALQDGGSMLAALRAEVRRDPSLARYLSTPHMLDVVCVGHLNGRSGATSPTTGGSYDRYVSTLLHRDRSPRVATSRTAPFDVPTTHRFLVWLARLMTVRNETTWYPDHLSPSSLPGADSPWPLPATVVSRLARRVGLRRLATAATYGLAAAVLCGVMYGLQMGLGHGGAGPLNASPAFGVVVALTVFALVVVVFTRRAPRRPRDCWPRIALHVLVLMLAGGLHKGLTTGREQGSDAGWEAGLTGAVVYGLSTAAAVALGLVTVAALLNLEKTWGPARWTWSWRRLMLGADTAAACAVAVGFSHAVARLLASPDDATHSALTGLGYGVIMGLGGGLLLGLSFMVVDLGVARPAARWRWSARRLLWAAMAIVCYGILHWLLFVQGVAWILGPDQGPLFSLVLGVTFCLTFGLGYSLVPELNLPVPAPARALRTSLRVAVWPALASAVATFLATAVARTDIVGFVRLAFVVPAVLAALMSFWFAGGAVWLAHHVARQVAHCAGILPRNLLGFLVHADERMLLDRRGGGYRFPHSELQRHIADERPGRQPDTATDDIAS